MGWGGLEEFFLKTILGVICLGALGSLFAIPLIWLVKKIYKLFLADLVIDSLERIFYPYIKLMRISREIRDYLIDKKDIEAYRHFLAESLLMAMLSLALLFLFLVATVLAFLLLWPKFPYAVAFMVCISLFFLHGTIGSSIYYGYMRPDHYQKINEIFSKRYRTFKDYRRIYDKEIEEILRLKEEKLAEK